jgi:hypothetical protein
VHCWFEEYLDKRGTMVRAQRVSQLALLVLLLGNPSTVRAEGGWIPPSILSIDGGRPIHLGDTIHIAFAKGELQRLRDASAQSKKDLTLFLDGVPLKGAREEPGLVVADQMTFSLSRSSENSDLWDRLIGESALRPGQVTVAVGTEDGTSASYGHPLNLRPVVPWKAAVGATIFLIALLIFYWQGRRSAMLRDSGSPPEMPVSEVPYSLGRVQMAWWTILILFSLLYIWMVTGEFPAPSTTLLTLMGIGAGTALGAAVIDANAMTPSPDRPTKSRGLLYDILDDGKGFGLHRVQMVLWTLVVTVFVLQGVVSKMTIPEIGPTMLALVGISNGLYVGFKLPESKA